jgi:hypothetical protein
MKNSLKIFLISLIPMFFVSFLTFTLAWNPPTGPAPTNNTDSPLHVGTQTQYKHGSLEVKNVFEATGVVLDIDSTRPTCDSDTRGVIWFEEEEGEELFFVCKWNGSEFIWISF